ncbi:GntR family transcriptional regulator [Sebaldella sp. S0638]|uniref:GntR family transcriptional regulator n=1 Tax=Sebaldella sp. S0638 TaxID=2957809 RepID=UPI0020A003ED|nr:GntR family transcriptional regulator [Sebaldella sp. S0638]MCP1226032.1 GntR family transcriptional regulator [Sebaldella sp. S0638]
MKTDLRVLAYNYIKDKILNNEYTSNQIISEKMISDELSISKTPVKEAFLYLESENFVVINPRKSVSVREVDLKLIKDIFQVRVRIEPLIVELTINSMNKEKLTKSLLDFKKKFTKMSGMKNVDNNEFDKLYDNYRYFFADNCGNLFFSEQMNLVYDHLHRIRKVLYGNAARRLEALEEHIYIINCILDNSTIEFVKELCEKHIEEAQMDFFKNLDNLNI